MLGRKPSNELGDNEDIDEADLADGTAASIDRNLRVLRKNVRDLKDSNERKRWSDLIRNVILGVVCLVILCLIGGFFWVLALAHSLEAETTVRVDGGCQQAVQAAKDAIESDVSQARSQAQNLILVSERFGNHSVDPNVAKSFVDSAGEAARVQAVKDHRIRDCSGSGIVAYSHVQPKPEPGCVDDPAKPGYCKLNP